MKRMSWQIGLGAGVLLAAAVAARAQQPYIGFAYPAGGRQGSTFRVTLGGQAVEGVSRVFVSGSGVQARVIEYNKKLNPQELQLLNEQMRELKDPMAGAPKPAHSNLVARIEKIVRDYVDQPASAAIANLIIAEVAIAADAPAGQRELRVGTPRGLSNPLVFFVGELPEITGPPLPTSRLVTLGKEAQSLRRKPRVAPGTPGAETMTLMATMAMMGDPAAPTDLDDDETPVQPPCTVNGQIAQGTVDRYRFSARKGQQFVIRAQARELVPYMADAVPGWFQPVVALVDARGREVAYNDDYRFKPDPVLACVIPADGDYRLVIRDAIYRGREDFVYRLTLGELPFVTGVFPLGGRAGATPEVAVTGFNLAETSLKPALPAVPGVYALVAHGRGGVLSNPVPFALDTLPDCLEQEPNDTPRHAQRVSLPIIVNGRIARPDDRDVFQFEGRAGEVVVAEVNARRLDSPLDAVLKLTDAAGRPLAFNDDREDAGSGLNTHHADSYIRVALPADGVYCLQLGDAQHNGGPEYAYRLRLSAPQPDFELRVVPSSFVVRTNAPAFPAVHVIRKDGFTGPIKLALKDAPPGFELAGGVFTGTQTMTRVTLKARRGDLRDPVALTLEGWATNGAQRIVRPVVPAEDRMQAFLWRHLVPAQEWKGVVLPPQAKR